MERPSALTPSTAASLASDPRHTLRLALGDAQLDAMLGGGIDVVGLTEVAGEAGAGKTQLVLQLMLQAQLPPDLGGLGGGAVYLHGDTANVDPALKRLHGLAESFARKHAHLGAQTELLKKQIFVMQVDSPDDLWNVVNERVPTFLMSQPIRLLVVDSVGGLYRPGADEASAHAMHWERAQHAMRLAARLKQISAHFNVAVVVTNQVSDKPLDERGRRLAAPWEVGACGTPDGSIRVPALGIAWAGCVNTRLVLTRTAAAAPFANATDPAAGGGGVSQWSRAMHVAWSPRLAQSTASFEVRDQGLVGVC